MDQSYEQLRKELDIALEGVTKLADGMTKNIERVNTLFENCRALEFRIETARGETQILLRMVGSMLGRECLKSPSPAEYLDILLAQYFHAAEIFEPDPIDHEFNENMRKLGIDVPGLTPEELAERERNAATAETYRSMAAAIRDEAMHVVSAAQKR